MTARTFRVTSARSQRALGVASLVAGSVLFAASWYLGTLSGYGHVPITELRPLTVLLLVFGFQVGSGAALLGAAAVAMSFSAGTRLGHHHE